MQFGQANKYCGKARGLGSRLVRFSTNNTIWICSSESSRFFPKAVKRQRSNQFNIVPIVNKEVWGPSWPGSCYMLQGPGRCRNDPVPCPQPGSGTMVGPGHCTTCGHSTLPHGEVPWLLPWFLLWWGVVVCRHFRQYQTCKLYLTMYGMRAIIGDAFTSYLGLFILECFFCPFQKNVCLIKLPPLSIQIRNLDVCMLYFVV